MGLATLILAKIRGTSGPAIPVNVTPAGAVYVVHDGIQPLPAGASTAANQVIMITSLQLIDDLRNALVSVGLDALLVQQAIHDLLNCNANIQVGDVDVANANPVPVSDAGGSLTVDQATHDNLNVNANLQVGDVDVGPANPVPIEEQEVPPTDASVNNPSFVLTYVAGNMTNIAMTIGVTTYNKPLTYDANGNCITIGAWA